jgi:hypothetical protein
MTASSNNPVNTNQLPVSLDVNPDDKGFGETLVSYLRRTANAVNTKESGLFLLQENANFEQWYTIGNPGQNRTAYRTTLDFVFLNGGNIPVGTTTITLTSSTQPPAIKGYLFPVQGFGAAIDTAGNSYFLNEMGIFVRYNNSTNTFFIQNNIGVALTWCVFVVEYLKN